MNFGQMFLNLCQNTYFKALIFLLIHQSGFNGNSATVHLHRNSICF